MNDSATIKELLLSILKSAGKPQIFKHFYEICLCFSVATINLSKNQIVRINLQRNMDCSVQDLACDCLWKLFIPKEGRLIEFEKYFQKHFPQGIENVHPDRIKADLAILIKARTQQGLSLIREEWGENYFEIRKAINTETKRANRSYSTHYFKNKKYISNNHGNEIDFNLPQIEKDVLLSDLYLIKMKKYDYAKILRVVFDIINSGTGFCKAIEEKLLLDTLKEFYHNKLNDFLESNLDPELKNVEYTDFGEGHYQDMEWNEND
jgi:hypothetical protein